jgi:hypothetical protein
MFSFCMNLMYVIRCRLCFLSESVYKLCFLSSNDGRDDVIKSVATVDSSSDGWMMPPRPSLLGAIVATGKRRPILLSYYCSDALVAQDQFPVATVAYNLLLQCLFRVVNGSKNIANVIELKTWKKSKLPFEPMLCNFISYGYCKYQKTMIILLSIW